MAHTYSRQKGLITDLLRAIANRFGLRPRPSLHSDLERRVIGLRLGPRNDLAVIDGNDSVLMQDRKVSAT